MLREDTVKDFKSFLSMAKIKWIVNVDDENSSFGQIEEKQLIRKIVTSPRDYKDDLESYNINTYCFDFFDGMEIDDRIMQFNNVVEDQKAQWFKYVSNNRTSCDNPVQGIIEKLKQEKIIENFEVFSSIIETKKEYETLIEKYKPDQNNRILWLIDRDFSKGGGGTNTGLQLVNFIADKDSEGNICFILTANVDDIEPQNIRSKFLEEQHLLEYNLLISILSKDEFHKLNEENYDELIKKLLIGLWGNYNFLVISRLAEYIEQSAKLAKEELLKLPAPTARHIILKFPETEGVSVSDTIYRILTNIITKKFGELCTENTPITQIIGDYKSLDREIELTEKEKKWLFKLIHCEKYDDNINTLRKPIDFGDIFKIRDDYYILISQSCDIIYRKRRKLDQALLVRLKINEEEEHKQKELSQRKAHQSEPLKYLEYQKQYILEFRDFILFDFDILDLCVFNDEGEAKISKHALENKDILDLEKIPFDKNRIDQILENIYLKKDSYDTLEDLKKVFNKITGVMNQCENEHNEVFGELNIEDIKRVNGKYKHLMNNPNFKKQLVFPEFGEDLSYSIKRICKLREPFSLKVYSEFTNYHSRIGVPGDYAKEVLQEQEASMKEAASSEE